MSCSVMRGHDLHVRNTYPAILSGMAPLSSLPRSAAGGLLSIRQGFAGLRRRKRGERNSSILPAPPKPRPSAFRMSFLHLISFHSVLSACRRAAERTPAVRSRRGFCDPGHCFPVRKSGKAAPGAASLLSFYRTLPQVNPRQAKSMKKILLVGRQATERGCCSSGRDAEGSGLSGSRGTAGALVCWKPVAQTGRQRLSDGTCP